MKFFEKDPLEDAYLRLAENELYDVVTREVMSDQVMPGIWGRAFSDTQGDMDKSKALYIKYRVQDLMDRAVVEQARQEQLKEERKRREREKTISKYRSNDRDDMSPLSEAEINESIKLIRDLKLMDAGIEVENDLDYLLELAENSDISWMDLRYLRALKLRLSK
jgi:hypothetical protein